MGKTVSVILLAVLFLISAGIDWIEYKDELRDMKEDEEYDELYERKENSEME